MRRINDYLSGPLQRELPNEERIDWRSLKCVRIR